MSLVAVIFDPTVALKILRHLHLAPRAPPPARVVAFASRDSDTSLVD